MNLAAKMVPGAAGAHLELAPGAQQKLLDHLALIEKWNKVYNLTAVREPQQMVAHHLLDCLAVVPHIVARTIVDVGSGAGFPGIPLAVAMPESQVTLLDCSQKKAAFLRQASIELGLDNVEVVCERAENWRPRRTFEAVLSRAFSDLRDFVTVAGHLCGRGGVIGAMKGVYPHEEIALLPHEFRVRTVVPLTVPGLQAQRHLVLMERAR